MIVVNSNTRQFTIPGADLVFGVEADSGSTIKQFQCPRYVGKNLDLAGSFIRMNYRNANGEIDSYLVKDVTVDGDNVVFGWELTPKVTMYRGNVSFVMCVVGPDTKVKWHTTLGRGQVLEGLEPDVDVVESETADVVAALITMVEAQTEAVEKVGAEQVEVVKAAAKDAEAASVAEIEAKGVNTRESIPEDYTALSEAVDTLNRSRAGAIVCEATGSAVVVNDASNLPMQGLRIFGRSTQDGIPTPDAPVEIKSVNKPVVSVYGKNLLKETEIPKTMTSSGITCDYEGGGVFHIYGTHTGEAQEVQLAGTGLYLPVDTTASYTLVVKLLEGTHPAKFHFFLGLASNSVPFRNWFSVPLEHDATVGALLCDTRCPVDTLGDVTQISRFWIYSYNADLTAYTVNFRVQVWLEQGETPTSYEPYVGQTISTTHTLPGIPVASGGNYTDSDGQQWICDEVDLERGVYVQRVNSVTYDGTDETWALNQLGSFARFTAARKDIKNSSERTGFLCTHFVSEDITTDRVGLCFIGTSTPGQFYFYPNTNITTVDQWKEWLMQNPITVYFALATPIETALSETEIAAYRALHSNYPNTTVLNDAGAHMVVKYAADTKLYIDNKIKEALQ